MDWGPCRASQEEGVHLVCLVLFPSRISHFYSTDTLESVPGQVHGYFYCPILSICLSVLTNILFSAGQPALHPRLNAHRSYPSLPLVHFHTKSFLFRAESAYKHVSMYLCA